MHWFICCSISVPGQVLTQFQNTTSLSSENMNKHWLVCVHFMPNLRSSRWLHACHCMPFQKMTRWCQWHACQLWHHLQHSLSSREGMPRSPVYKHMQTFVSSQIAHTAKTFVGWYDLNSIVGYALVYIWCIIVGENVAAYPSNHPLAGA